MNSEKLFEAAEAGATILTANQRTQRQLHRLYDARQRVLRDAWPTPDIFSWNAWIDASWQEYLLLPGRRPLVRLNAAQELVLWEQVIRGSRSGRELLRVSAIARLAQDAWRLLQEYGGTELDGLDLTQEGAAFRDWARGFARRCEAGGWIDSARIAGVLCTAIAQRSLAVPERVILAGFDQLTPQQEQFLSTLRAHGCACEIAEWPQPEVPQTICRVAFEDRAAEMQRAAEWARGCLLGSGNGAADQVGIVVPDLGKVRERVERIFAEVLTPEALGNASEKAVFEISLGRPLVRYPLVHTALELLRWLSGPLPMARVGALLRSVYLRGGQAPDDSSHSEAGRRALLDAALCGEGAAEVSIDRVYELAAERRSDGSPYPYSCPVLAKSLGRCRRQFQDSLRSPSAWSRQIAELLETAGWPGDRIFHSAEHQSCQAWLDLLKGFGTLDVVQPALSFESALNTIDRLAAQEIFQPENVGAPVQVLGMLEASGSGFQHLWVMAADDERWPARVRSNPLLPPAFQRRYGMPHASAADDLAFAERVMARLRRSARQVVFSHARADDDRALRPSPLIVDLPEKRLEELVPGSAGTWVGEIAASAPGCELREGDGEAVCQPACGGGVKLFQLQAACPFRAFVELRLSATAIEEPVAGLSAKARGTLVHSVLQRVWQRLQSSARLSELSPEAELELIASCADEALKELNIASRDQWMRRFAVLERERMVSLVSTWLKLERERSPFRVVATEEKRTIELSGLCVSVRVDRVDELLDGSGYVILDYKTGALDPKLESAWNNARPDEPQLPLYAVATTEKLGALAFAFARAGNPAFKGDADADTVLPGVEILGEGTLREKVERWRTALTALGQDFSAGKADVDPKNKDSCQYCRLHPLCRINEGAVGEETFDEGSTQLGGGRDE